MVSIIKYINRKDRFFSFIFFITSICNSRCRSCFNWRTKKPRPDELTLDEIKKFSLTMGNIPHLSLSGGEPFLRKDLPELCEVFIKNNNIEELYIPTNGILTEDTIDQTKKILDKNPKFLTVSVSIDGLERTHNLIRGRGWKQAAKTVKKLVELKNNHPNFAVKVNTVICNLNYSELTDLTDFVKTLGVDMHSFDLIRGKPSDIHLKLPPNLEKISRIVADVYNQYKVRGQFSTIKKILARAFKKYMFHSEIETIRRKHSTGAFIDKNPIHRCIADKFSAVMYENGDLTVCELKKPNANIRDMGYDFKKWKPQSTANCSCYHPCFQNYNVLLQPKYWHRILKYIKE